MYDGLVVTHLRPGTRVSGIYRGEAFHELATGNDRTAVMTIGRVFLDTTDGPTAIAGDGRVLSEVHALNLSEGDQITIARSWESVYHVTIHMPDESAS